MLSDPDNAVPSWPPLSEEAAVTILAFLQHFTECFESRYFGEIHRYYEARTQANRKTDAPPPVSDPPF
ncbi:hypothetical protein HF283_13505 [Acidithiobacillus ferrooxidans]|uniref:hypothetical protein n=1 Tax=Acidithiobacillus ferridurans TaxID=1232575 RepID=UPI001C0746AC|nr:hypothetical protein [Acidithiobacillus ferridurans]MBU2804269.1 hypothetical protein [Acidithiobacillus ferridurans]MBU2825106.1 hypothetical protein [Acidithiobacillus ferrooxidans]